MANSLTINLAGIAQVGISTAKKNWNHRFDHKDFPLNEFPHLELPFVFIVARLTGGYQLVRLFTIFHLFFSCNEIPSNCSTLYWRCTRSKSR